jgi:hypothetical protein
MKPPPNNPRNLNLLVKNAERKVYDKITIASEKQIRIIKITK